MGTKTISYQIESKLPEWATPEALKALHDGGKSLRAIGLLASVSRETVRQLIKKAKGG